MQSVVASALCLVGIGTWPAVLLSRWLCCDKNVYGVGFPFEFIPAHTKISFLKTRS